MTEWSWFSFGFGLLVAGLVWMAVELRDAPAEEDAVVWDDGRLRVLSLLADDGFAATFQTTGQYRSALIRALAAQSEEGLSR